MLIQAGLEHKKTLKMIDDDNVSGTVFQLPTPHLFSPKY